MGEITHGISYYRLRGEIHPSVWQRRKLKRAVERTVEDLRAAAVPGPKSDILIDLIRFDLTIIGLYSVYISKYGTFKEGEIKKGNLKSHDILKEVFAAVNSCGRLLDRMEWKKGEDVPTIEAITAEIIAKRKKK